MVSDAQKRAHASHIAKLAEKGVKLVSVRLSEAARSKLVELAKVYGSKDKAVEALLTKAVGAAPVKPAKEPAPKSVTVSVPFGPRERKPGDLQRKPR